MSQTEREIRPYRDEVILVGSLIGVALWMAGGAWLALQLGPRLDGDSATVPPAASPVRLVEDLVAGDLEVSGLWTSWCTGVAIGWVVATFAVVVAVVWAARRALGPRRRPDRRAAELATLQELRPVLARATRAKGERLGVDPHHLRDQPGVPLGRKIPGHARVFSSWEDMILVVAGPRTAKSTAYAIPAIAAAPGAVLATSNKRDVVDTTRLLRARVGKVWVFDPQHVMGSETAPDLSGWWWNPLTYIAPTDPLTGQARRDRRTGRVDADEARAEKLAGQLCTAAQPVGSTTDSYFDTEAQSLIGLLLLAAAVEEHPVTVVYEWLNRPEDEQPAEALAKHGFATQHDALHALASLPERQRESVYGTARARLGWMRIGAVTRWVTAPDPSSSLRPGPGPDEFHPSTFATSTDTLYQLSKAGEGSAGPVVAALTMAVIDALEDHAAGEPAGRLRVPFLGVLDEAANICRVRNLDSYYSHFGSRGIVLMTILQNWAQGEDVWTTRGMEKLWSAANTCVYAGGVDDDKFLRRLSDLTGSYRHLSHSQSSGGGRGGRSYSRSVNDRTIYTIGDLRELPRPLDHGPHAGRGGRALLLYTGVPPVLIEPEPWWANRRLRDQLRPPDHADVDADREQREDREDRLAPWRVGPMEPPAAS